MFAMIADKKTALSGIAVFVLVELFNIISAWVNGDLLSGNPAPVLLFSYLFVSIFEETVFRILPVRFFAARLSSKRDEVLLILVTSAAFGLFHLVNLFSGASFSYTVLQIIFASCIGAFFCVLFLRTGSPLLIVVLHFVHDVVTGFNTPELDRGIIYSGEVMFSEIVVVLSQAVVFLGFAVCWMRRER